MEKQQLENAKRSKGKSVLRKKILYTVLIHAVAAALFVMIYLIPSLFTFVQNTEFRGRFGGGTPLGMVLLVLPALIITFIWDRDVIGEKGRVGRKILLSLWLVFNVAVSLTYLILIYTAFS